MNTNALPYQIGIKTIDGVTVVFPNDIICLEKSNGHTLVYLRDRDKPLKSLTPLSGFKKHLPAFFAETCRSSIINRRHIFHLEKGKRTLRLSNNHVVKVSEMHLPKIMQPITIIS